MERFLESSQYNALLERRGADIEKYLTTLCEQRGMAIGAFAEICNGKPGFQNETGGRLSRETCRARLVWKNYSGERLNTVFEQLADLKFKMEPAESIKAILSAEREALYDICYPILSGAANYPSANGYLHACLECISMSSQRLWETLQQKDPDFPCTATTVNKWYNGYATIPSAYADPIADILAEKMQPPKVPVECKFDDAKRARLTELLAYNQKVPPSGGPRKPSQCPLKALAE